MVYVRANACHLYMNRNSTVHTRDLTVIEMLGKLLKFIV